jgi:ATP-dependent DNA helicase RecG
MPVAPIEHLTKILQTEAQRGYDNKSILGGLDKLANFWPTKAQQAGVDSTLITELTIWLQTYPQLGLAERQIELQGWLEALKNMLDPGDTPPPTPVPAPVADPASGPKPAPVKPAAATPEPRRAIRSGKNAQAAITLQTPLTALNGVGEKAAEKLEKLNLFTIQDALHYFPRRHIDYSSLEPIQRLRYGAEVTIIATIQSVNVQPFRNRDTKLIRVVLADGTGSIECNWFNQLWLTEKFKPGVVLQISGKVDQYLGRLIFSSPDWEEVEQETLHTGRIVPIYPLAASIPEKSLRKWLFQAVQIGVPLIEDPLPTDLLHRIKLLDLKTAIHAAHFPETQVELAAAQNRLAFDEILFMQLGFLRQRSEWQGQPAPQLAVSPEWQQQAQQSLPFNLTAAQERVLGDIFSDLTHDHPMNRLVQGDVGSGKTAVAALALAAAVQNGWQGAIMAPTSILAEQHAQGLQKLLAQVPVAGGWQPNGIRLLLGATPSAERQAILADLAAGQVQILVGTHALIQEGVNFAKLGLVVIDEQHRFGVAQRAALRQKGQNPHLLVTTATPIPRSLALSIYGDLDVSSIDALPPGRQPIQTRVIHPRERERAYRFIHAQIERGRQAYIICPLVSESEKSDARAAIEEHARLQTTIFPEYRLGLLHGKMKPVEKDAVMQAFRAGETQILVATSVIEVGVDVPNATVILIEGANRFGLAQLHQLRGRVGRGQHLSYCLLQAEQAPGETAAETESRLQVLESTNDGFVLAEKDLEMRGPGDFLGTRQAGFPSLQHANLGDIDLIDQARRVASQIYASDPQLNAPEHQRLAAAVSSFWQRGAGEIS